MIVWSNTFFREPKSWNGAERRDSQSPGPNTPGAEQFVKYQQSKEKENSETVPHTEFLKMKFSTFQLLGVIGFLLFYA